MKLFILLAYMSRYYVHTLLYIFLFFSQLLDEYEVADRPSINGFTSIFNIYGMLTCSGCRNYLVLRISFCHGLKQVLPYMYITTSELQINILQQYLQSTFSLDSSIAMECTTCAWDNHVIGGWA
jgi:hypothetical protein